VGCVARVVARVVVPYSSEHSGTSLPQSCQDRPAFLDRPVRHARSMRRRIKRKEEKKSMGLYVIMHIYEVPARNQYEATSELMTARQNHFDKVFLKKVLVKDPEIKLPQEKVNVFAPKKPAKWGTIFKRQLTGKA
jgi:hypothetical protein